MSKLITLLSMDQSQNKCTNLHKDPQALPNDHAGSGTALNSNKFGEAGFKERVDFGQPIGWYSEGKSASSFQQTSVVRFITAIAEPIMYQRGHQMHLSEKYPIANILLSGVRAFLGRITPEIISIGMRIDYEGGKLEIVVLSDELPSGDLKEEISCAETEIMSDFAPDFLIETKINTPGKQSVETDDFQISNLIFERWKA